MVEKRRVIFVTYDGAELLDLSGPGAVFSTASELAGDHIYEILTVSPKGGLVRHSCGVVVDTVSAANLKFRSLDTVLVVGSYAEPLKRAATAKELHSIMRRAETSAERFGSICTGAFVLGAAGLLSRRKATTHWMAQQELKALCPEAIIDDDALYIADQSLWTSAGVTTGIDMALAMIERDHGAALKAKTARQLVVYAHRPGSQAQFSELLETQTRVDEHFSGLVDWLIENIANPIKVEDMANVAGMSERSFQRHFKSIFEQSPGKFFECLRLDRARALLEAGEPVKSTVSKIGLRSEAAFRSAFKEQFGVTPGYYGQMRKKAVMFESRL